LVQTSHSPWLWALGQGKFINGGSVESRSSSKEKGFWRREAPLSGGLPAADKSAVCEWHSPIPGTANRKCYFRDNSDRTKYPFVNFIGVVRIDTDDASSSSSTSTSSGNSSSRSSIKDTYSTTEAARSSLDEALQLAAPANHGSGMTVGEMKKKKENKKSYEAAEDAERMLKPRLNLRRAGRSEQRGRPLAAEKYSYENDM
jgi:hypothetical protein